MQLTLLSKRRAIAGVMAAGLAAVIALVGFDARGDAQGPSNAQSVVIISGDGMGIQQRTAIQYATYGVKKRQPMDALPVAGFLDTIPRGRSVSDSAAGATAWAIGQKTRNGLVGLPPSKQRVPTLLEIAKEQGKSTGLVNDHDITNATLAAFGAPIDNRDRKRAIARRLLRGTAPDVMMGGTEKYWYPEGHPGKIPDESPSEDRSRNSENLVAEAKGLGLSVRLEPQDGLRADWAESAGAGPGQRHPAPQGGPRLQAEGRPLLRPRGGVAREGAGDPG